MSYYTQVHLNLSAGKSYTTAERVLMLYAVNTYSALMIHVYTIYMYAIYTQQVCSIWEGTNLDEDVEPLSELDVGSDQVTDEPTQLFIELVDLILDIYQRRSK